jgi:uncharacterized protein (DUF58 family)
MTYPTRAAVLLMAAGAPIGLALGVVAPRLWLAGVAWIVLAGVAIALDTVLAAQTRGLTFDLSTPASLSIGGEADARLAVRFDRAAPARVEAALAGAPILALSPARRAASVSQGGAEALFGLRAERRGAATIESAWARWRGPLGLIWKQAAEVLDHPLVVTPDIESIKDEAVRLFSRDALHGLKTQLDVGDGAEFHALRDFQPGMDTRTIDWKRSARHGQLVAKEYRAERNNPIILTIDCGRAMCEPVEGLARIDWALNGALLLAFVSLKLGDRAGLYSFDARPHALSGPVSGARAFTALQRAASRIDYAAEEANYTLGLSNLADRLERRSLIVVFTEFTDPTSAQLMVENVARLLDRHLVVFIALRDQELDDLVRAPPATPDDVSRAVIAQSLLREREAVTNRLRRMGVEIVEAAPREIGTALLDRYLEIKRRGRLG